MFKFNHSDFDKVDPTEDQLKAIRAQAAKKAAITRKTRAEAKKLNELRQEAIHTKGFNLDLIYPLSLANLKGLLKGKFAFNEFNEFVPVY